MISATTVESRIKSALDDDGTGRYSWEHGIREAVNNSIDYVILVFNAALGMDKLSEESLREISVVESITVSDSTLVLSDLANDVWSILAIYPSMNGDSLGGISAYRASVEEWGSRTRNYFAAGYDTGTELTDYAYLAPMTYGSDTKIPIAPTVTDIGVVYLKYPTKMTETTAAAESSIEFPKAVTNILVEKALAFLGQKENTEASTYVISEKEVQDLITLMT